MIRDIFGVALLMAYIEITAWGMHHTDCAATACVRIARVVLEFAANLLEERK
jgi:hypothetical protein